MAVSAETYIVISLMFAVFAAVATVGTSVVLGAGFERLRTGFEVIRKQTGYFADMIHRLDQRTSALEADNGRFKEAISSVNDRVERVEKETDFMAESIEDLHRRVMSTTPVQSSPMTDHVIERTRRTNINGPDLDSGWIMEESSEDAVPVPFSKINDNQPASVEVQKPAPRLVQKPQTASAAHAERRVSAISELLSTYFRAETRTGTDPVSYH